MSRDSATAVLLVGAFVAASCMDREASPLPDRICRGGHLVNELVVPDAGCLGDPFEDPLRGPVETGAHVDCVLYERRSDEGPCGPGRIEIGTEDGRAVCQVCQWGDGEPPWEVDFRGTSLTRCAGSAAHWYYAAEDPDCWSGASIVLTAEAGPVEGSLLLQCADGPPCGYE